MKIRTFSLATLARFDREIILLLLGIGVYAYNIALLRSYAAIRQQPNSWQ